MWKFFPEITSKHMNKEFMGRLISLREEFNKPMNVTSSYRPPPGKGNHDAGRAVDINIWGGDALKLIYLAVKHGFTGVGVKQTGPYHSRFVHLDNIENSPIKARPWLWTY